MIRAINSYLTQRGENATVGRLQAEMGDLLDTVEALDSCCMAPCRDADAIDRLVRTARIQASLLAGFLERIPTHDLPKALRRAPRSKTKAAVSSSARDADWMAEWRKARGVGGMTRKEFCRQRGISLEQFLRAQDRHRKRLKSRR